MGLLDILKNKVSPEPRTLKTEEYIVVGTNYYEGNIKKCPCDENSGLTLSIRFTYNMQQNQLH